MEEQAGAGTQVPSQDGMYGSRKSRQQKVESKGALAHEDRRVKELTEGILYDFLPAALNVMLPRCEDMLQELDADRCRAVASAALAVSALMNAPPGFLEFLLCVPWRKLSQLYPKPDSIDKLVAKLQVTDEERRKLVNTRVDPALMGTVLDFMYKEKHAESVPPMLQLTPVSPLKPDDQTAPVVVRETVAAVLDGATPLHCAALRGNPAQVDHLLYCGADPTIKTAAGELPIELVPVCGDRSRAHSHAGGAGVGPGQRSCRCMAPLDQEVWECRSRLARSLIARRCFFSFGVGLFAWLRLVVFCLLCLLGQAGCYTSISRPVVERHIETRRQQKIAGARARAHNLVTRMRSEAEAGHRHLQQAKRECMESAAFQRGPPDMSQMCFTDPTKAPPPPPPAFSQIPDINVHLAESGTSSTGEELPSEKAFKCFVRSVHALQSLDLHGDTVPQVFAELVGAGGAESRETHVLEDEQADLYSCWAESVLLKFRGCTCPGCAALAIQAVRMAHIQATRLFGKVDRVRQTHPERWRTVGEALARVVYVHICLLLETEAQGSPTRSLVWRAEQCLREWDRLEKAGLTQGAGVLDPRHVAALQRWAKTADSDLYLAEALHGQGLPPTKTLQEVVLGAVTYAPDGAPILARPVSAEVVASLEQALTLSSLPSPLLAHIVRGVVTNAVTELAAAARLRELVAGKGGAAPGGGGTADAVAALSEALHAAEPFRSRLGPEIEAALELRSKWVQRASAVEKLEGAVEEVRAYTAAHPLSFTVAAAAAAAAAGASSVGSGVAAPAAAGAGAGTVAAGGTGSRGSGAGALDGGPGEVAAGGCGESGGGSGEAATAADMVEWERRMKQLEAAMNDAKDANVSVTKAKRLLKEMAAVAAAAEASRQLEAVMARRPSGPLQLKLALNKAEAAASALGGLGGSAVPGLAEVLGPLMAAARRRLDSERAAEALSKAAASFRSLADLGRLEAAIYNAKKIGAEELDPESYRTSLELRAHLQDAARGRGALETALRNLQNQLRPEDAEALERALQDASKWEDLLASDMVRARKALEQWRSMTVCDAKLGRLLREGSSTAVLARAIQEAAASGVKVQHAKRVLKLLQALEGVLGSASDVGPGAAEERHGLVKARLEAAEAAGAVAGPVLEAARRTLARLTALTARDALEAALKPHSDWPISQKVAVLREALDKAEGVFEAVAVAAAAAGETAGTGAETGDGKKRAGGEAAADGAAAARRAELGQPQAAPPKLANGSAVGRTSRGKRSNGGEANGVAAATPVPASSDGDAILSTAPDQATAGGGASGQAALAALGAAAAEDETVQAVRELVRRARLVLEADQAELARIERERQDAERQRREAQERERQERVRQEQERQRRERAEAAERERSLAEKREKAKAEKSRQHQQQSQPTHKGRGAGSANDSGHTAAATPAGAGGGGRASGSRQGAGAGRGSGQTAAGLQAVAAAGSASSRATSASGGTAGGKTGPSTVPSSWSSASTSTTNLAALSAAPLAASSQSREVQGGREVAAAAAAGAAVPAAAGAGAGTAVTGGVTEAPDTSTTATAATTAAAVASASGRADAGVAAVHQPSPQPPSDELSHAGDGRLQALPDTVGDPVSPATAAGVSTDASVDSVATEAVMCASASVGLSGMEDMEVVSVLPAAALAVVHTRGDSLESLGEVVRKLNREVIEALDMDSDAVHGYSGGGDGIFSVLADGVGADGTGADVQVPGGPPDAVRTLDCAVDGCGAVPGARSITAPCSGGESFRRSCSGAAATADSVLDQTASQRTSSVMSSVASADDVMLPAAGGAAPGLLLNGNGPGLLAAGGISCYSLSMGQSASGGSSGAAVSSAGGPEGVQTPCEVGASGSNSSNGGGGGSKPRFGFVDLGGASWGLDSPLLTVAGGTASLFTSLQSSMGEQFGAPLNGIKLDTTAGGGAGASAWSAVPGYSMFAGNQRAAASGDAGPSEDGLASGCSLAGGGRLSGQCSQSKSSTGMVSPSGGASVALGPQAGGGLMLSGATDGGANGIAALAASLPGGSLASPRTTVATASAAGAHGLIHMRSMGGGGPGTTAAASATGHLSCAGGAALPGSAPGGAQPGPRHNVPLTVQIPQSGIGSGAAGSGIMAISGFWTPPSFQLSSAGEALAAEGGGGAGGGGVGVGLHQLHLGGGSGGMYDWAQQHALGELTGAAGMQLLQMSPHAAGGVNGVFAGSQHAQQQQQQQQLLRAMGATGGAAGGALTPMSAASAAAGAAMSNRVCRFFLQGFCRDGERCRFAHVTAAALLGGSGNGGGGVGASPVQLLHVNGAMLTSQQLQLQQQHAHAAHLHTAAAHGPQLLTTAASPGGSFANSGGAASSGSGIGSGLGVRNGNPNHGSAVGSFAFGAPGAEAFAPVGSVSMGRMSHINASAIGAGAGAAAAPGSGGEPLTAEQLLSRTSAPQLRHHGGLGLGVGYLPPGLAVIDRAQLSAQSAPPGAPVFATAAAGGGVSSGGSSVVMGPHQQAVQLRDNVTGATFNALLTVPGTPTAGQQGSSSPPQQQTQQQQQQQLLLSLPDDLTFSPPSSSSLSSAVSNTSQFKK